MGTVGIWRRRDRERKRERERKKESGCFFSFSLFYLSPALSARSPSLTNFFGLTLVLLFIATAFEAIFTSVSLPESSRCFSLLSSALPSIDLFRDLRLLLEIDSDISAPGGLLKLHTFLGGSVVYSISLLPIRLYFSLFAYLSYLSLPSRSSASISVRRCNLYLLASLSPRASLLLRFSSLSLAM